MVTRLREALADVTAQFTRTLVIRFDGSCEPVNPGGVATCGWTIDQDGVRLAQGSREVCRGAGATNNVAEWSALGFALRWLLDNGMGGKCVIEIYGDSQLVINQLNGDWDCWKPHLQKLLARCQAIIGEITPASWRAMWIPRADNSEADALSRQAYEQATGKSYPERNRR